MRKIRIKKSRQGHFLAGILVLAICGVVSYNKTNLEKEYLKKQAQLDVYNQKLEEVQKEQDELKANQEATKEEIENIAREKLGLVYEDEIILKEEE